MTVGRDVLLEIKDLARVSLMGAGRTAARPHEMPGVYSSANAASMYPST
jgi:hypothetical protein